MNNERPHVHINEIVLPSHLSNRRGLEAHIAAELERQLGAVGTESVPSIDLPHLHAGAATGDHRIAERAARAIAARLKGGAR